MNDIINSATLSHGDSQRPDVEICAYNPHLWENDRDPLGEPPTADLRNRTLDNILAKGSGKAWAST